MNGAPAADIAVTKTVDNPTPVVGTTVTFTVTATNRGPTGATGVVVTDALPAGLTLVSATPSQGDYTAPTWTVGALAANASATLVIVATVDTPGALVNRAEKTQQVEADPNPANDSASVTLNAVESANLKIFKAATRATVSVGETLTFDVARGQPGAESGDGGARERRAAARADVRLGESGGGLRRRSPASGRSEIWPPTRRPCSS